MLLLNESVVKNEGMQSECAVPAGMAMFKTLFDFILPALMSTHTWQKAQHWVARQIVKFIPWGGKLVSAAGI